MTTASFPDMVYYRLAVLGDPVEHSRSPQLHTVMLRLAGLEGEYLRVSADEMVLGKSIEGLRRGEWDGLNVTMPLKESAVRMADRLSSVAERSGSVNTLIRAGSAVAGHSTDSFVFHQLIDAMRFPGKTAVLVLGAGGSAAAALAAMDDTSNVYVAARRIEAAEDLTRRLGGDVVSWGTVVADAIVINTTPLGMGGESLPTSVLQAATGLIDLPYGGRPTPAVELAKGRGVPHVDGHEFLLRQAIASFALWTGVDLQFEVVSDAMRNI